MLLLTGAVTSIGIDPAVKRTAAQTISLVLPSGVAHGDHLALSRLMRGRAVQVRGNRIEK